MDNNTELLNLNSTEEAIRNAAAANKTNSTNSTNSSNSTTTRPATKTTHNSYLLIGELPKGQVNKLMWVPVPPGRNWVFSLWSNLP